MIAGVDVTGRQSLSLKAIDGGIVEFHGIVLEMYFIISD